MEQVRMREVAGAGKERGVSAGCGRQRNVEDREVKSHMKPIAQNLSLKKLLVHNFMHNIWKIHQYPQTLSSPMMAAQEAIGASRPSTQSEALFEQLETYDWATDAEFQSGLQAILHSNPSSEQAEHLTLRARCFYYSRQVPFPALRARFCRKTPSANPESRQKT